MDKERTAGNTAILNLLSPMLRNIVWSFINERAGMGNRFLRHLMAGGIGTLMYAGSLAFLVEIVRLHPVTGVFFAFILLEIYTYIVNRLWVYTASNRHIQAIPRFIITIFIALFLNMGIMYLVVEVFDWWYGFGLVCAVLIVPLTNFMLNYYWVFNRNESDRE
jgi:putative flippase GtrA